jgi:hypothetical protein
MNKKLWAGIGGIVVIAAIAVALGVNSNHAQVTKQKQVPAAVATASTSVAPQGVSYAGVEGKTALELLKEKDPNMVTKGEGANAYVTTINGYTAKDAKKEYWAFYVDGKLSDTGAGAYTTKAGDKIEWKIATY